MAAQDGGGSELMPEAIITTGFADVDNLLATLEVKLQRKAIRKGTRAGAKVVLPKAKSNVPHGETGLLESTLTVRVAKEVVDESGKFRRKLKRGKEFGHMVTHREGGAGGGNPKRPGDPYYSHFVEFGTVFQDEHSYIRRALYDSTDQVLAASRKAIIEGVNEIARKAKK